MALHGSQNPDFVSRIAQIGAPVLVIAMLGWSVALGHWQHVAFLALVFVVFIAIYGILFARDQGDDGQPSVRRNRGSQDQRVNKSVCKQPSE